jgi:hypothetical protein
LHASKPRFERFETWGACSRCGARVAYNTLARERLTGLLVCTSSSGRPVKPCLDPWPAVFDFQVHPDRSIEAPPEPLPARWGLDDIWSVNTMYTLAPSDAVRLNALLKPATNNRGTADFTNYKTSLNQNQDRATLQYVDPQTYDGTFVPSNSVRTVDPPDANEQLEEVKLVNPWFPPWTVVKGLG